MEHSLNVGSRSLLSLSAHGCFAAELFCGKGYRAHQLILHWTIFHLICLLSTSYLEPSYVPYLVLHMQVSEDFCLSRLRKCSVFFHYLNLTFSDLIFEIQKLRSWLGPCRVIFTSGRSLLIFNMNAISMNFCIPWWIFPALCHSKLQKHDFKLQKSVPAS